MYSFPIKSSVNMPYKQAVCFVHSVNDTDMHRHMQMHYLMSFCEYFYIKCKK